MDDAAGWLPDPEREDQERYWNGADWTDQVRPASPPASLHLPEHVPDLQRALAAATAEMGAVEERLAVLFERTEGNERTERTEGTKGTGSVPARSSPAAEPSAGVAGPASDDGPDYAGLGDDEAIDFSEDALDVSDADDGGGADGGGTGVGDGRPAALVEEDGSFAELDAALAAEEPHEDGAEEARGKRRLFRRRP